MAGPAATAEWSERLAALDVEGRLRLLETLSHERSPDARQALLAALGDKHWRVRKTAVEGLLGLGPEPALLEALVARLGEPDDAGLRNAAAETLIGFGDAAVPAVRAALKNKDHDVRLFACNILGSIGDPGSVSDLVAAISDPDENVRAVAVENLGNFRLPEATRALLGLLDSGDLPTKFSALEAIARQQAIIPVDTLKRLLKQNILRKAVFDVMSSGAYAEALALLVEGVADGARSSREAALRALCLTVSAHRLELEPKAVELVRERLDLPALERAAASLESEDTSVRRAVVFVLAASGEPAVIDALLGLWHDEGVYQTLRESLRLLGPEIGRVLRQRFDSLDERSQAVAALALGKIGDPAALPILHRCLRSDFGNLLRAAAEAVGELGDAQSVPDLVERLAHPYPDVREAAVGALESIGAENPGVVLPHIDPLLKSTDPLLRKAAVRVVGHVIEDEEGLKKLALALGDVHPQVRAEAAQALGAAHLAEAGTSLARAAADEDAQVRRTVVHALGSYSGEESFAALRAALHDPDLWVRSEAVRSLGRVGTTEALEVLEGTLSESALHPVLAVRVLEALEDAELDRAIRQARALLEHHEPDVVLGALAVFARAGTEQWQDETPVLAGLLSHEHWNVRAHTAALLGKLPGGEKILRERLRGERDSLVQKALRDALVAGNSDV